MKKKKRGSAIIIAVLLISAIGGIAFGFGRSLLSELGTSTIPENGIAAYYSAESGVEEAFLRYKINPNAEVPTDSWTVGDNKVFETKLTGASAPNQYTKSSGSLNNGIVKPPYAGSVSGTTLADQAYDLRMGSKTKTPDNITISRDEAEKFDLSLFSGISGLNNDVDLSITPPSTGAFGPFTVGSKCLMIEARLVGNLNTNSGTLTEYKKMLYNGVTTCGIVPGVTGVNNAILGSADPKSLSDYQMGSKYGITGLMQNIRDGGSLPKLYNAWLSLKPIGGDATIKIESSSPGNPAGQGPVYDSKVTINSTGYYGGAVRTLTANIDRQSGTLYDLFDYVIYKP